MPVTARLSKAFYDRFGEDIVTELVEWFNLVDSTYRSELRETNALNFARFDSKLEQRMAQLESKLEQRMAQLEAKLGQRMTQLEATMDVKSAQLESRLTATMEQGFSKQTRFLYVSLVAQVALILAALAR